MSNQVGIAEQFVERRGLAQFQSVVVHEAFGADQGKRRILRGQSQGRQLLRSQQALMVSLVQAVQH